MAELSQAKYFIYRDVTTRKIYSSKDFYKLADRMPYKSCIRSSFWAILPTQQGDQLYEMDWAYSGEPIIFERFMHINSFLGFYGDLINID